MCFIPVMANWILKQDINTFEQECIKLIKSDSDSNVTKD